MTPSAFPSGGTPQASWGPPPRGVFVDILGTLVEPSEDGHFPRFDEAKFYDGVLDGLFRVTQAHWNLYLIGNIDAVAFGHRSPAEWKAFQADLHAHLKGLGIRMRRDYTCVDHPEGIEGQNRDSVYLLPGTGAMHHAAQADEISLPLSWIVGDSTVELVAGWRAGCRVAGVQTGEGFADRQFHVDPEIVGRTAAGVFREIALDMTMLRRAA